MYQTYQYDDNNNIVVINEYNDLFEAYKSIDTNCKIYNFTDYYLALYNKYSTINELTSTYYNRVKKIMDSLHNLVSCNIKDIIVLFVGTEEQANTPYFMTNDTKYIVDLNNIIEEELDLHIFIRKNPKIIVNELKDYFKNHIDDFLYIVDTLIEYNLYDRSDWRRKNNINVETDLQHIDSYNNTDVYNALKYNTLYSSSEYDVLQNYIADLDYIIELFMNNIYILKELQISKDLAAILRYI